MQGTPLLSESCGTGFPGVQPAPWVTVQHGAGTVLHHCYMAIAPFSPPVSGPAASCQELNARGEITPLKIATDVFRFQIAGCGEMP